MYVSTDVFAEALGSASPPASRDLVLTIDHAGGIAEVARDHAGGDVLHCSRDHRGLVERIAQSASVVIEHGGNPDPILLGPRPPACPDDAWLASVVACLLAVVPDLSSCCHLVSAVLSRNSGVPVTLARRPASGGSPPSRPGWGAGPERRSRFQFDGRWVREIPLGFSLDGWSLVVPEDFPADAAGALSGHPLMADLAEALSNPGRAGQAPLDPIPVLRLIHAVVTGDAGSFAPAAAALTHGGVMVVDGDGALIASSGTPEQSRRDVAWEPAAQSRDILLCDDTGLWGAVRLMHGLRIPVCRDGLLRDLGLTLVKSICADRRRMTLESQLVVLSCLAGEDAERLFRRDGEAFSPAARRLVVVRAATAIEGHAGARLKDAVVRAAARTEGLPGLCLVVSQGALIGVYPDAGHPPSRQRRCWAEVIGAVGADWPLTVAVGSVVAETGDFPLQHRLVREVAKIQQSGSRYFDLPGVAMLDDLGPLAEVIGMTPGRELVPFVERILGDLLDDQRFGGQLIETLYAYLQTSGSPRETGALLHLHPSTVKYRIRVIRELLGPRLEDQSTRFDLELAVRLCLAANLLRKGRPGARHPR
jgi:hypothetical protein